MQLKNEYISVPLNDGDSTKKFRKKFYQNRRKRRIFIAFICLCLTFYFWTHIYIFRDLIYLLRPLFDHETEFIQIPHYHDSSMNMSELCKIHGWTIRTKKARVIDVIIFSIEFDLLELRLRELWDSVDVFIVVEADRTFTGSPKPLWLQKNLSKFEWAETKLKYHSLKDVLEELKPGTSPFYNENLQRNAVSEIISKYAKYGDLIISADVDEIPRSSTIDLIKSCDHVPDPLHLQLRTYFYSFEYYFSLNDSWRAKIQTYSTSFYYNHSQKSKFILADSGWHCTFCFKYLKDFRFKMTSYSHNDRLLGRKDLLENEQIQKRICSGKDIFDMWPEVYSWHEMIQKFGSIQSTKSYIDLPKGLIKQSGRFRYLLPGNCIREDYHKSDV